MKRNAFATLIKDLIFAAIAWGIGIFVLTNAGSAGGMEMEQAKMAAMLFAGIPFGWRWSSKIITALTFKGVAIKLLISFFLGWLAIFVVLGIDAVKWIAEMVGNAKVRKACQAAE